MAEQKNATDPVQEEQKVDPVQEEQKTVSTKTKKGKYKWNVHSFRMPGSTEIITAEDAETDADLIETILNIPGQGILKKIY